jgi:hypothetical protein
MGGLAGALQTGGSAPTIGATGFTGSLWRLLLQPVQALVEFPEAFFRFREPEIEAADSKEQTDEGKKGESGHRNCGAANEC